MKLRLRRLPTPVQSGRHPTAMTLNYLDPKPLTDPDDSTIYTADTPPETVADLLDADDPLGDPSRTAASWVPWPGSTYILRCASSGRVVTLLDGPVVLAASGGRGCIHWDC